MRETGHANQGWCLIHRSGDVVICPRVFDGCAKDLGEAGYLHVLRQRDVALPRSIPPSRPKPINTAQADWRRTMAECAMDVTKDKVRGLAERLGVTEQSLDRLSVGLAGSGKWTFPMRDAAGQIIGVRIRGEDGRKWAIPGSRNGLFIPHGLDGEGELIVCEGPTDTAAMLSLGFEAIGRPSCNSCVEMCAELCSKRQVVIVADDDGPGLNGAEKLADALWDRCPSVRVVQPPYIKDAREWVQGGATRAEVAMVFRNTIGHAKGKKYRYEGCEC